MALGDEYWKSLSIHVMDHKQAAHALLTNYMPYLILDSYLKTSNTSNSNLLKAEGSHKRCQLSSIGNRLNGAIRWRVPFIPTEYWRSFHLQQLFVFIVPMVIEIRLTLGGKLLKWFDNFSQATILENSVCSISEAVSKKKNTVTLNRLVKIKKKFVRGEELKLLPDQTIKIANWS